jgi:SAM-dependent methyltransferase
MKTGKEIWTSIMDDWEIKILTREQALRSWFTRDVDPIRAQIDGLDIGWGGIQRWATSQIPAQSSGLHLDFACGYGTFLAQLGWRFPSMRLIGLNIDFIGPHATIRPLLAHAKVVAMLVQADARWMPFPRCSFDSVSCFMGLQDIEIGFGEDGVRNTLAEAVRVLQPGGVLTLLDEIDFKRMEKFLEDLPVTVQDRAERRLDIQWNHHVASIAIRLYTQGWVDQMRIPEEDTEAHHEAYQAVLTHLETEVEQQIVEQGYYVPFGPVRIIVARKGQIPSDPLDIY